MLLIASKRVSYGGKTYNAGEQFSATKEHAGLLTTLRFAHYPPEPSAAAAAVETAVSVELDAGQSPPKRKYKRRDKTTDAVKPKRQYRRRDMTAEETQSE